MPLQLLTLDPRLPDFGRDTDTIATMTGAMCGPEYREPAGSDRENDVHADAERCLGGRGPGFGT